MNKRNVVCLLLVSSLMFFSAGEVLAREGSEISAKKVSYEEEQKASKKKRSKKVKYVKSKGAVKSLLNFSRSRSAMIKELKRETKSYKNIKKAVNGNRLKNGSKDFAIKKRYGKPTIILEENDGKGERWVYKDAKGSYFKGDKIYLDFDEDGKLSEWREVEKGSETED